LNFYMGHFATLKVATEALDGYRKFLEMRRKITGRPHPHEARARDDAKEVLGRHVLYGGSSTVVWLGACFCTWQLTLSSGTQNDSISRNTFNWREGTG
jgi:hypothetical protein